MNRMQKTAAAQDLLTELNQSVTDQGFDSLTELMNGHYDGIDTLRGIFAEHCPRENPDDMEFVIMTLSDITGEWHFGSANSLQTCF